MTLAELLATNPDWPTSLTDALALTWLEESVNTWRDLSQSEMLRWCAVHNIIARFESLEEDADAVIQSIAKAGIVLITSSNGLEATNAETRTMMTTMRAKNMVTQAQLDDLIERATVQMPRWQDGGVSPQPTIGYIAVARAQA